MHLGHVLTCNLMDNADILRCSCDFCKQANSILFTAADLDDHAGYKHFLTSNFADGKNIQFVARILIETYLVDNSDRNCSESPGKSTVGDRNDGSQK